MKETIILLSIAVLFFNCTSSSSDKEKELLERENAVLKKEMELQKLQAESSNKKVVPKEKTVPEKQVDEPEWNYSGLIGKYPIKMNLVFEYRVYGSWEPVTGYYFYIPENKLIILKGMWQSGNKKIWLDEFIDGEKQARFSGKVSVYNNTTKVKDIAGTWGGKDSNLGFSVAAK